MNELQIFNFNENVVRVVVIKNDPWFVLKDVCDVLGIKNSRDVFDRLDDDEKGVDSVDTLGGKQAMSIINESGLYNVILRSDKPQAKPFRKWTTSQVLPSIRKHGGYLTEDKIEEVLSDPDTLIRLATDLKQEREKRKELEAKNSRLAVDNAIMKPKAEYFDDLVEADGLTNFRNTAKMIGIKEKEFITWLLEKGYLYRDSSGKLQPFSRYNPKYFKIKETINKKTEWVGTQTMVTIRGREHFNHLINRN